jgi:hypothetical protein
MTKEVIDMIVKTAIGFLRLDSDDELVGKVQSAITGLTGNPDFPTPSPTLAAVTSALSAFTVALANAVNHGKEEISMKNGKRAELVSLMRQLASYVTITADGDMTKMLSSGFPYQKPFRTPIGPLEAPVSPTLRRGPHSGQLHASVEQIYGAYCYNWRVALVSAPDTYVQTVQTTASRTTFKGLTSGETYVVTANAVGSDGPSDWSDDAELMVV